MSALLDFKNRLANEWLIPFCSARGYSHEGFVSDSVEKLTETDARDFLLAVDRGLVHHEAGIFTAACSKAKEQIFWQGARNSTPRKITLWLEPIITVAGLMRLNRDFGWTSQRLGMQSKTWAFDLVGYAEDQSTEQLVCEVKKTEKEVDDVVALMKKHSGERIGAEAEFKGAEQNAIKKVVGLRQSESTTFWALGPNGYGYVFNVIRAPGGAITLGVANKTALFMH